MLHSNNWYAIAPEAGLLVVKTTITHTRQTFTQRVGAALLGQNKAHCNHQEKVRYGVRIMRLYYCEGQVSTLAHAALGGPCPIFLHLDSIAHGVILHACQHKKRKTFSYPSYRVLTSPFHRSGSMVDDTAVVGVRLSSAFP